MNLKKMRYFVQPATYSVLQHTFINHNYGDWGALLRLIPCMLLIYLSTDYFDVGACILDAEKIQIYGGHWHPL